MKKIGLAFFALMALAVAVGAKTPFEPGWFDATGWEKGNARGRKMVEQPMVEAGVMFDDEGYVMVMIDRNGDGELTFDDFEKRELNIDFMYEVKGDALVWEQFGDSYELKAAGGNRYTLTIKDGESTTVIYLERS